MDKSLATVPDWILDYYMNERSELSAEQIKTIEKILMIQNMASIIYNSNYTTMKQIEQSVGCNEQVLLNAIADSSICNQKYEEAKEKLSESVHLDEASLNEIIKIAIDMNQEQEFTVQSIEKTSDQKVTKAKRITKRLLLLSASFMCIGLSMMMLGETDLVKNIGFFSEISGLAGVALSGVVLSSAVNSDEKSPTKVNK